MTDARRALPSVSALLERARACARCSTRAPRTSSSTRCARRRSTHARSRAPRRPTTTTRGRTRSPTRVDASDAAVAAAASSTPPASCCTRTSAARRSRARRSTPSRASPAATRNLEYDLERGERGSRYVHCASLLRELTGAEDALVVNNCAAALVLALNTLADGREAHRLARRADRDRRQLPHPRHHGEERRAPASKSARRTARTSTTTSARSASDTGAIVKVHRSNFAVQRVRRRGDGARARAARARTRRAAPARPRQRAAHLARRLSGCAASRRRATRVARRRDASSSMSGDKLLGGPQAGIIVGDARRDRRACGENPLARVVSRRQADARRARGDARAVSRSGARAARDPGARACSPRRSTRIRARAERCATRCARRASRATSVESDASVGGGAFPDARDSRRRGRARRRRGRRSSARLRAGDRRRRRPHRRRPPAARPARACPTPTTTELRARRGGRAWLTTRSRRAAFLDRDGTIIDDAHYLADPDDVELLPARPRRSARSNERGVAVDRRHEPVGHRARARLAERVRARARALDELLARTARASTRRIICPHHPDVHRSVRVPQAGHAALSTRAADAARARSRALAVRRRPLARRRARRRARRTRRPRAVDRHAGRATSTRAREREALPTSSIRCVDARARRCSAALRCDDARRASPCSPPAAGRTSRRSSTTSTRSATPRAATSCSSRRTAPTRARSTRAREPASRARAALDRTRPTAGRSTRCSRAHRVDLIVLAGYLRLVPADVTRRLPRAHAQRASRAAAGVRRPGHVRRSACTSGARSGRARQRARPCTSWTRCTTTARSSRSGRCRCSPTTTSTTLAARVLRPSTCCIPASSTPSRPGDIALGDDGRGASRCADRDLPPFDAPDWTTQRSPSTGRSTPHRPLYAAIPTLDLRLPT